MEIKPVSNIRVYFATWNDLPNSEREIFAGFMGGYPAYGEAFYNHYFTWYNIAHEIGHVLRAVTGTRSASMWQEETACNRFAVAYWLAKGQFTRLQQLHNMLNTALSCLPDPCPLGVTDREEYINRHWQAICSSVPSYAHLQFSMVKAAIQETPRLPEVLQTDYAAELRAGSTITTTPVPEVSDQLPFWTSADLRASLLSFGLPLPEINVICEYHPQLQFVLMGEQENP